MSIHFYTQPYREGGEGDDPVDILSKAEAQGYKLGYIAGYPMFEKYGREGGPFAVFKDGEFLARFEGWQGRDAWLQERLQ